MATRTESPEFQTVRGKFAVICGCISVPDVEKFAGELLQGNLISDAGHQTAIAVTGSSPTNKIAHLVSEAANSVSNSPDNFHKFVSILESRNTQLASALRRDYLKLDDPKKEVDFVTILRQIYTTDQPPTWDPLPQCQYVKLAMIKEKRKRYVTEKTVAEHRVKGDVDKMLTIKVPVDSDKIFDGGIFDDERQVILVEGVGGMGKTSLAYQYAKKWAEGKLSTFDVVALVRLRDEHDVREVDHILPHLLFLASGNSISKEMAQHIVDKQKVLLILDGWDESPLTIRTPSFLKKLLRSISPQTKILITSRPDFSLDIHGLSNRVEILGFTKSDMRDYFEKIIKSQLPDSEVKLACDELSSHFHRYPVIESCCYIPLNAAILAYIFIYNKQTLPVTRCELFKELILCCIARELETRQSNRVLEDVSSFEDLPADLKEQLHSLSELAFKGVMQNKVVFTQKELTSHSALGLLHIVQGFGRIGSKSFTSNFIHLAIQELLAAFYISRLRPSEHVEQIKTLLGDNLKLPVLQFYAGLTGLTNENVQSFFTGFEFDGYTDSPLIQQHLLSFLNCMFEAQLNEEWFFKQMICILSGLIDLCCITLAPLDCLSVNFFISSYIKTGSSGKIVLRLSDCEIDDQFLGLLLGIIVNPVSCVLCVLEPIITLELARNKFTDNGIEYLVAALNRVSNSNLEELEFGNEGVTDMGLVPLLEALPKHRSLKRLRLFWTLTDVSNSLEKIQKFVKNSTVKRLEVFAFSPSLKSEEGVEEWISKLYSQILNLRRSCWYHSEVCVLWMNVRLRCTFSISSQLSQFLKEFCDNSHIILVCDNKGFFPKLPTHVQL